MEDAVQPIIAKLYSGGAGGAPGEGGEGAGEESTGDAKDEL